MQRVCFLLRVWPDMLAALTRHGWHNYSLFLDDDGLLVGYFETPDFVAALAGMQTEEVNTRWQTAMRDFFTGINGASADTSFKQLAQVFYLP
jgi:L-rhamnose mutarotase